MFVLITCVALFIASSRHGYRVGHQQATAEVVAEKLTTRAYNVEQILQIKGPNDESAIDPTTLMDLVKQTVSADSWVSGEGSIEYFEPNKCLLVTQTPRVHKEVADLLEKLPTIPITPATPPVNADK